MKYLVMECHLSYAVVLDEEGRFLKVANLNYKVGQTVTDIIEMQDEPAQNGRKNISVLKWISSAAALVACLVLAITLYMNTNIKPYASVYMSINPEVRIDVDKENTVVKIEGINSDGKTLIEGYQYKNKKLDPVMDELVDMAIDAGYLTTGGTITISFDADDNEWIVATSGEVSKHLDEYLKDKVQVDVQTEEISSGETKSTPVPTSADKYHESDYGRVSETAAPVSNTTGGESNYDDSVTDYNNTKDASSNYNETNNYSDYDPGTVINNSTDDDDDDSSANNESNYNDINSNNEPVQSESDNNTDTGSSDYDSDEDGNHASDYDSDEDSDEDNNVSDYENDEDD